MKTNTLRTWMKSASGAEQARLARLSKTTVGQLRQLAGGYRTKGLPHTNAELAIRLERASLQLHKENPALVPLRREDLSRACARCEFAKACRS